MRTVELSEKRVGRVIGALLLLHLAGGLILPYVLLNRVIAPPGFLAKAAAESASLRSAAVLFIFAAGLVLAIAVAAWPILRPRSERLAVTVVAVAAANLALQLVECGALLAMLSLSQEASAAGAGDASPFATVALAVGAARRYAHYTQLLTVVGWLFLVYFALFRTALVPRLIAALGMAATLVQILGVPARALAGYAPVMEMAMPLAPVHIALAVWLIWKGFRAPHSAEKDG